MSPLLDHLWQSTLVAGCVMLLTLALRRQAASLRFWLWFAASLKFLLPFAALAALGGWLSSLHALPAGLLAPIRPAARMLLLPAHHLAAAPVPPHQAGEVWVWALAGLWLVGAAGLTAVRLLHWRRVNAILCAARDVGPGVRVSDSLMEPGLIGIIRPVVLLPAGLAEHLAPGEMAAILAHEAAHRRRRDNLIATLHMLVETLFWFWPVVWLVGARLIAERERACDESVLAQGHDPHLYAGVILKVCRFCVRAPLACVSGAAATWLAGRVERIAMACPAQDLGHARALLLVGLGLLLVAGPLAGGMVPDLTPANRMARAVALVPHAVHQTLQAAMRIGTAALPHPPARMPVPASAEMTVPAIQRPELPAVPPAASVVVKPSVAASPIQGPAPAVQAEPSAPVSTLSQRLAALLAKAPMALAPSGAGDPDAVTCRVPRYLPGSRLKGPKVCKTNRIWTLLRVQQWEIGPDGASLISTANTLKPRTLASLAAQCAVLGCR